MTSFEYLKGNVKGCLDDENLTSTTSGEWCGMMNCDENACIDIDIDIEGRNSEKQVTVDLGTKNLNSVKLYDFDGVREQVLNAANSGIANPLVASSTLGMIPPTNPLMLSGVYSTPASVSDFILTANSGSIKRNPSCSPKLVSPMDISDPDAKVECENKLP